MSLLDLLFPEQAQASHLRGLLRHQQLESKRTGNDRGIAAEGKLSDLSEQVADLANKVRSLEARLNESDLLTHALAEMLFQTCDYTQEDLRALIEDIDARDGVKDGRITPEKQRPVPKFVAKRSWKDQAS